MAAPRNAVLVRRVIDEIWNAGDLDLADVLFAPTYVNHAGLIPDLLGGPEGIKFSVAFYRAAFPRLHVRVDDLVANGNSVALRWTAWNATLREHTRNAPDQPRRTLMGTTLSHVAGGQVVESWTTWDAPDALRRLGVLDPDEGARRS